MSIKSCLVVCALTQCPHPLSLRFACRRLGNPSLFTRRFAFNRPSPLCCWEGGLLACSPSAAGGDPGRGYAHILSPLDVMKAVIKENVGLDLGEDGALGSPVHEESLVDGQTPLSERLDGSDAHVPAAAGSHHVGTDGGFFLAELLADLPKVHGKSLQGTLEAQQDTWEWAGNKEASTLLVPAACSTPRVSQGSAEHRDVCGVQDWAVLGLVLCTGVLRRKVSVVVLILIPN